MNKAQYAVSRETQYAVFKIWNEYNILEDIKRGPYSKKSPIRRIQYLDTPGTTKTVRTKNEGPSMKDTRAKSLVKSAKRHEENSNLIKEIRATTDVAIRNQGASIKTLEIQIGHMSKVLQERGFGSLPSSTETNPRDQVKSISTTNEVDSYSIRRIRSS
ncbi:hypothetical protein Tco_0771837 [Tanacetum coccineum]|uniref:Uncharacterized protein n=1 Tax=Tanacetum coccineum TaxID=301880 RepID=A0ABQ4ZI55_9ASTR